MSKVTDIILTTPADFNVAELNAYLARKHTGTQLVEVGGRAVGSKYFGRYVSVAAVNHLDHSEFLELFHSLPWQEPEKIQLLMRAEDQNRFDIHLPKQGSELC